MTENEAAERATTTASDGTSRCSVRMGGAKACGRAIHPAPAHDETPVCLMHSHDPQKGDSEFQKEFDAILEAAADRHETADFTRFVFTSANYDEGEFAAECSFFCAIFMQEADFSGARFTRKADFSRAKFTQKTYFSGAKFTQEADFSRAKFTQEANFRDTVFTQKAYFSKARFTQEADFRLAKFAREADLRLAKFMQDADFTGATFIQEADFQGVKFLASADFRETNFRKDDKLLPGPVFSLAEFSHPEAAVFYKTNLCQALFHNCDVSGVTFSSVEWRRRKGGGRHMLFEEEVYLDLDSAAALQTGGDSRDKRDYSLIAELYQQLKKNYDERKDYWTAGDFHYGEMEMKRLHSRSQRPWVRWLHQHLGLVAWYRYASSYGESYLRPLLALLIVLGIFTALYPLAGLRTAPPVSTAAIQQAPSPTSATELNYRHFSEFARAHPGPKWIAGAAFFGHSLMTTLSVASLQKELRYEPVYPWGRALALLQLLLTSALIALFLLALRRQFRR